MTREQFTQLSGTWEKSNLSSSPVLNLEAMSWSIPSIKPCQKSQIISQSTKRTRMSFCQPLHASQSQCYWCSSCPPSARTTPTSRALTSRDCSSFRRTWPSWACGLPSGWTNSTYSSCSGCACTYLQSWGTSCATHSVRRSAQLAATSMQPKQAQRKAKSQSDIHLLTYLRD